jgi:hypothetical protein
LGSPQEIVQLILTVEAVGDLIPHGAASFFTAQDTWLYTVVGDDKTCQDCWQHEAVTLTGEQVLALFPFLVIVDAFTIMANVHNHCRCFLERIVQT